MRCKRDNKGLGCVAAQSVVVWQRVTRIGLRASDTGRGRDRTAAELASHASDRPLPLPLGINLAPCVRFRPRYMDVRFHDSIGACVAAIRAVHPECAVLASDLQPGTLPLQDALHAVSHPGRAPAAAPLGSSGAGEGVSGDGEGGKPVCVVMGNEDRGISDEARCCADKRFVLPMRGFAESFNLSVAWAV